MTNPMIQSCLPWAALVIASVLAARIMIWFSGARLNAARVRSIHSCEKGSVQSLSFVLVLPFFVMTLMMIVQASHLMIGNIVVHYGAFASARSASVWIPANVSALEDANSISSRRLIDTDDLGWQYEITPTGEKFSKIRQAAVLACFTLGPSRDMGYELPDNQSIMTANSLTRLYQGLDPDSISNSQIPQRLENKLAYSVANTDVRLTVWHRFRENAGGLSHPDEMGRQSEYPVPNHSAGRDAPLYANEEGQLDFNEIGWQDHITAEVTYNLPLLPGPIRFFAPRTQGPTLESDRRTTTDDEDSATDTTGNVYIWPITASATLGNEGQKRHREHWQEEFGR